jgi:hypothetical protein
MAVEAADLQATKVADEAHRRLTDVNVRIDALLPVAPSRRSRRPRRR